MATFAFVGAITGILWAVGDPKVAYTGGVISSTIGLLLYLFQVWFRLRYDRKLGKAFKVLFRGYSAIGVIDGGNDIAIATHDA